MSTIAAPHLDSVIVVPRTFRTDRRVGKFLTVQELGRNITLVSFPVGNLINGVQAIAVSDELSELVYERGLRRFVFSLFGVRTISIAIAELLAVHAQKILEEGGSVKLCHLDFVQEELFGQTRFSSFMPMFPDVVTAERAF